MKKQFFYLLGSAMLTGFSAMAGVSDQFIQSLKNSQGVIYQANGAVAPATVKLFRTWNNEVCNIRIVNTGSEPIRLKEVILGSVAKVLPGSTPFYAEGFQMLSQTAGTLEKPENLGNYTDAGHYRIPQPDGYLAVYNLLRLYPSADAELLLGYTSSNRWVGKFYISKDTIRLAEDLENMELAPGKEFQLEELMVTKGKDGNQLLDKFAGRIQKNHPRLEFKAPPDGWCSWYCFGPKVTAKNVYDNLDYIKANAPVLKYIQLDDGYQPHMGDWLAVGNSFGGNVQQVLHTIKEKGFEPAIWVAPFICDSNSAVFKEHPEWLVKDSTGQPLRSDKVTFGGWRWKPWYVLDGTNPAVQQHLTEVFTVMRQQWGVTYFKLDANFWGAIHGGVYFDKNATRVEAYRRGMEAIIKGTGNAFLLGCNHPIWPSLGLVHGSRSSMDIKRKWEVFERSGRENLYRSWQNGRLWWNDPDCLVLTGDMPDNEYQFHAALLYATGGMLLSGDDLTTISPERLNMLRKAAPPTGKAAAFENTKFEVGRVKAGNEQRIILLNWDASPKKLAVKLDKPTEVFDYWTGKSLGKFTGTYSTELKGHDGKVLTFK